MSLKQLNKLFDTYNKSLAVVKSDIGETFVCPICLREFGRDTITNRSLAVEHVPPRSIGSCITTLTCRTCNNNVGNRLQNQMKNYVTEKEFLAGKVPKRGIPARAEVEGFSWSFVIREIVGEGRITGFSSPSHLPQQMKPSDFDEFVGKKAKLSLRLKQSPNVVNAAYLHSAYLALFHYLGYPYIMQPMLRPIREKITSFSTKGGIPHVIHAPGVFLNPRDRNIEIGMLWQSLDVSCLTVIIAGELVVMPFLNDSYTRIFEILYQAYKAKLEGRKDKKRKAGIKATPLLIDPECKFSTHFQFQDAGLIYDDTKALKLVPIHNI